MKIKPFISALFLIAICFSCFHTHAQSLIPRAGFSFATTSGYIDDFSDNDPDVKFISGYYAGVGYLHPLGNSKTTLQAEILWINKGQVSEMGPKQVYDMVLKSDAIVYRRDRYKLNYLEMPILLRKDFGKSGSKFFTLAGFSLSYGLTGKRHHYYSFEHPTDPWTQTINGKIRYDKPPERHNGDNVYIQNRFDVGLQVGLGVTVFKAVSVEARYGYGLTGFSQRYRETSAKNRVIQLGVALPLNLN